MKIAVIGAKGLPPKQGGIEHYCGEVYPRMVAQGHSVDLYARSSYTEDNWFGNNYFQGVRIISLPSFARRGVDAFLSSALGAIVATRGKYDIIHFHALGPALFTGIASIHSAKIVVTCQGLDWQRAKWDNFSSKVILAGEKAAVKFADEIIVVSEALQSYFSETYNRNTVYIPNAPASYPNSDVNFTYGKALGLTQERYLLFLGRLVPEKCPDLLIEAFLRLQPQGWKLVLAGGISDTKAYTAQILQKVASSKLVVFAGELHGERLAEIVRGAGLFVLPSKIEGLPLAMLEAMREGIPVIASDIPPHRQLLDQQRGLLFSTGDIDSCVKAIDWALNHPTELSLMAANAHRYIQRSYTWEQITAKNLEIYQKLLSLNALIKTEPLKVEVRR
ncbi:MAG: glycosyltransferase family 4 protein [Calothrix sp. C42_A2020_038]|nr:glycosyltransferase family 4 protein [Calothrix sp. C42_A2020_038]